MFWRHKNTVFVSLTLCFHSVNPMFSPRQSYVFRSHICHFGSHKVTPRRQQSATSTSTKCHIDGQEVPHRRPASPTSATTRLFAAENVDKISLHSPASTATDFYLFRKNTSPPHPTPRKARYTKGLKPVRCCPNTSLTPH